MKKPSLPEFLALTKLQFGDPESIAIARMAERRARRSKSRPSKSRPNELKIGKMHEVYGVSAGNHCKDCIHLLRKRIAKVYFKCGLYGNSGGPATDWRVSFEACGKFKKETT